MSKIEQKASCPHADGVICAATLDDAAADPALTLEGAREMLREAAEAIRCLHQYRDAMGGQGDGRYPCPRGSECKGRDCPDCANFTAPQQPEARVGGEVAAVGEPSAASMTQAFIERYESRYTPHTVELVMAEVRMRARELDSTTPPPSAVPEGWRPIETAPRDSYARLVYVPAVKCVFCVSWRQPFDEVDAKVNPAGWYVFGAGWSRLTHEPTHWMPLPAAPEAQS